MGTCEQHDRRCGSSSRQASLTLAVALLLPLAVLACKRRIHAEEPSPPVPDAGPIAVEVSPVDAAPPDAPAVAEMPPDAGSPLPYIKGSTHVHTVHSGDSSTSPEDVARWYENNDYDFIVITDHNRVTDFVYEGDLLVLRGIELTNNPPKCEPAPPEPDGKCRVHVNSLFVTEFEDYEHGTRPPKIDWRERHSIQRVDLYQAAIAKSNELGGLAQLNHPTWHWGTDGALLAELARRGMVLFEVANTAFSKWNAGDRTHLGTEAIWDAALGEGVVVYGVASDDAHHYTKATLERRKRAGKSLYPAGGGFVMVRANKTAASIRAGLARGDFYASTGVLLESARRDGDYYDVVVGNASEGEHRIELIGPGGKVLETVSRRSARFDLSGRSGYVRVVVRDRAGNKAWTQPVMLPAEQPSPN